MYLMYARDGAFLGTVEAPIVDSAVRLDLEYRFVEVPNLIYNDGTWEWEFTAPVEVEP